MGADDLATLRTSADLEVAHQGAAAVIESLNKAQEGIYEAAAAMGEIAPNGTSINNMNLTKALERVHLDENNNFVVKE